VRQLSAELRRGQATPDTLERLLALVIAVAVTPCEEDRAARGEDRAQPGGLSGSADDRGSNGSAASAA
jgi:hypothetical protein